MPLIIFEAGKMPSDKKEELVRELTDASARVTGIDSSAFIIYIHENEYDNIGVGGELLTKVLGRQQK